MKGSDQVSFGERFKEARIMKGLTQKQLAEELNIGGTTVTGYEKDNSEPSMNTISKIMEILDVDANFLFQDETSGIETEEKAIVEKIRNVVRKYRNLDQFGQETVDYMLEREIERVKEIRRQASIIKESDIYQEITPNENYLMTNAAHEKDGATEEEKEADNASMEDESIWKN